MKKIARIIIAAIAAVQASCNAPGQFMYQGSVKGLPVTVVVGK